MNNKYKYLILILVVFALLAPKSSFALFGVADFGAFDFFDQQLAGIEEYTGPAFTLFLKTFLFFIVGYICLLLSFNFLISIIYGQINIINNIEPIARAGWQFTSGLSNMLLIIIFIVIAFAFIFKIETFEAKKSLPRLIIVAILINFSFLFVQMLVDVSQIAYNTFLPDINFFSSAFDSIFLGLKSSIINSLTFFVSSAVVFSIPIVNAVYQTILAFTFIPVILPIIANFAIQAVMLYLLSAVFLIFLLLFIVRPFILELLLVLSPLAFVCLILKQTKKFWDKWFKFLLEWLLLGVVFLFTLVLGFSTIKLFIPDLSIPDTGIVIKVSHIIIYYFILFTYLSILLFVGKSILPVGAQAIIDGAKGFTNTAITKGLKRVKKPVKEIGKRVSENIAKSEKWQDRGKKWALSSKSGISRWAGRKLTSDTSKNVKDQVSESEKKADKMDSLTLTSYLKEDIPSSLAGKTSLSKSVGYLNAAIKKGDLDKVKDLYEEGGNNDFDTDFKSLMDKADKLNIGKTLKGSRPDLISGVDEKGRNNKEEFIKKIKSEKIKNISSVALTDPQFLKAVIENWGGQKMSALVNQFGKQAVEAIENSAHRNSANEQLKNYFRSQAGQAAGFTPLI